MFYNAPAFNGDIGGWVTGQVTDMSEMFYNASAFNKNIRGWHVMSGTLLSNMFFDATEMFILYGSTPGFNPITSAFFNQP